MQSANEEEAEEYNEVLQTNQEQLDKWASVCPDNFLHKYELIQAERSVLSNNYTQAEALYEKSRKLAVKNGFIQDAAICSERFAYACDKMGDKKRVPVLMAEAADYYLQWGANRKANM